MWNSLLVSHQTQDVHALSGHCGGVYGTVMVSKFRSVLRNNREMGTPRILTGITHTDNKYVREQRLFLLPHTLQAHPIIYYIIFKMLTLSSTIHRPNSRSLDAHVFERLGSEQSTQSSVGVQWSTLWRTLSSGRSGRLDCKDLKKVRRPLEM